MKFSIRQILASAAGAVIAAIIASTFGVKGTIVGVAIGSAAATFATALVAQSIERGQQAVKQVVVRAPDSSPLLRKLGGTGTTGTEGPMGDASSAPTAATTMPGAGAGPVRTESSLAAEGTDRPELSAVTDAPATQRIDGPTYPGQPWGPRTRTSSPRTFRWTTIAGTAVVVFVIALLFITAIELISGKPLAAIFGNAGSGPTVKNIFTPSPSPSPAPAPTTSTSTTTTTTVPSTSTTATSTTTSTTAPTNTTTTVAPRASTTTTTAPTGSARSTTTSTSGVPPR